MPKKGDLNKIRFITLVLYYFVHNILYINTHTRTFEKTSPCTYIIVHRLCSDKNSNQLQSHLLGFTITPQYILFPLMLKYIDNVYGEEKKSKKFIVQPCQGCIK